MATRGVVQCQKLTLYYCEHGGSSKAVRDFLASGRLVDWAQDRPSVRINVRVRNGKHPFVKADYLSGITPPAKNRPPAQHFAEDGEDERRPHSHQICLRGNAAKTPCVESTLNQLYNRSGRKITKLTKPVYTQTPSVQGVWTPALNLHLTPAFSMEMKE